MTRNTNKEAVVYGDAIPGSNFKSLFKSMVSNQQNLNQVGIDEFLWPLQSLGVKKNEISVEPIKIKYKNVSPYGAVQRHSTPLEYETEDIEIEKVCPPSPKQPSQKVKKIIFARRKEIYPQATWTPNLGRLDATWTPPGRLDHLTFSMFIN